MIIQVLGLIGAGKSTTAEAISNIGNMDFYPEPVEDNPFLTEFYKEPSRYGLTMQMFMLHKRFKQHQAMMHSGKDAVSDSSIFSDYCFASLLYKDGTITKDEYQLYVDALENMKKFIVYPDVMIYINCSPEKALERINKRARGCESKMPIEYLQKLQQEYVQMVHRLKPYVPIIVIDVYDDMDSLTRDLTELIEMIKKSVADTTQFDKVIKNWKL